MSKKSEKMTLIKGAAGLARAQMDFTSMKRGAIFDDKRRRSYDRVIAKEMRGF